MRCSIQPSPREQQIVEEKGVRHEGEPIAVPRSGLKNSTGVLVNVFIRQLTGVRFLAAAWVLLYHLQVMMVAKGITLDDVYATL